MRAIEFLNKSPKAKKELNELPESKLIESPESKREMFKLLAGQSKGKKKLTLRVLNKLKTTMNRLNDDKKNKSELLNVMYSLDVDEEKITARAKPSPDRARQHIQDMALDAIERGQK
jgi:hypothetical protein